MSRRPAALRARGRYAPARSVIGTAPWEPARLVLVAVIAIGVGVPLLLRML